MDHAPLTDNATERALRHGLTRLADGAPVAIADLEGKLARRVASARRRRRAALVVTAAVVVLCGAGGAAGAVALSGQPSPPRTGRPVVLPRAALSCPSDLGKFRATTARPGITAIMVPVAPIQGQICDYGAGGAHSVVGVAPAPSQLTAFITQLNAIGTSPGGSCADAQAGAASRILVRFGYVSGAEVDVLVTSFAKCARVTNGLLSGALSAPLSIPDLPAQNATSPTPWSTTGNTARPVSTRYPSGQSSSSLPAPAATGPSSARPSDIPSPTVGPS